jgi:hypothetical protein
VSADPAPKETRPDTARQAVTSRPAPERAGGQATSASAIQANGAASDAATTRMMGDGASESESRWARFTHGVADGAQIIAELVKLSIFNPFTGTMEGNLELGKALYYAQLVAPHSALNMISLNGANRGSNPVHIRLNLYHSTLDLTAPQLQIAGFHTGTATGKACELHNLTAHGTKGAINVQFASATLHDVTFIRGDQHLVARDVGLTGVAVSATEGASLETALHFANAHVHGLVYPGAASIDLDLPGGTSLDAVWAHQAPAATTATAPGTLPPAPDVLPPGASVHVELAGLHAAGVVNGAASTGNGGFDHLRVALVKNGADLASITIAGFHGGGSAATAGAQIDQVVLHGAPPLVDALLANQQLAGDPHVRQAMALIHQLGIRPSVNGTVSFTHVGLSHGAGGEAAMGDFASTIAMPGVGTLDFKMTRFAIGTADGVSGGFDDFTAHLVDEAGKELAFVELTGGSAKNPDPHTRKAQVKQVHARGNVAAIVQAGDALVRQMPVTVRSGFEMVRALGIKGDVTGSLSATTKDGKTEFTGSFQAHLSAGAVGNVVINVTDFHGNDTAAGANFRHFDAQLTNPRGKAVAGIGINNGNFTEARKGTTFTAGQIDARGDSSSLTQLITSIEQQSTALPAPVRVAFSMVRSYYVNGGGVLQMSGVKVTDDGHGHEAARLGNIAANFTLATGEHATIAMTALQGERAAGATDLTFDRFEATLAGSAAVGGHARILVEQGGSHLGATPAHAAAGATPDYSLRGHHAAFEGEARNISKLVAAIRERLGSLPGPIARAFEVVGQLATSQGPVDQIKTNVDATDLSVARSAAHGSSASGSVAALVSLRDGTVALGLHGFVGQGQTFHFESLDLNVADAGGTSTAQLRVGRTELDASGAVTVASVTAEGDAAKLRAAVGQVGGQVPEAIGRALSTVGSSRIDAAISSISVKPVDGGGLVTDAAVLRVNAAVAVTDGTGTTYRSPNAALAIFGAHVVLGPDRKPREIDATRLEASGNFSSAGSGRALSGQATIQTGAAKILFDATGAVQSVQAGQIHATGGGSMTTTPTTATTPATTTATPTTDQRLASHDRTTAMATDAARMIKSADVHAHTPITAGRYGTGMIFVDVPTGAMFHTTLQIRQYALTGGTKLVVTPKLDAPLWMKAAGADLETSGTQGALKVNIDGFFDQNVTKYIVGQGTLSLNVAELVGEIMGRMRSRIEDAAASAAPDPKAAADDRRDRAALAEKQRRWNASHTDPRARARDAATEPRTTSVGGVVTQGAQLSQTTGDATLELAAPDGNIAAHLHGEASGGVLRFGATDASVRDASTAVGGGNVRVHNVDSGAIDVSRQGDTTQVQFGSFSIEQLTWLAGR